MQHVEVLDTMNLQEVLQFVHSEGLCEDVENLSIGSNIPSFDLTSHDSLAHKVILYFMCLVTAWNMGSLLVAFY